MSLWADNAGDGWMNNWGIYTHPQSRLECAPRILFDNVTTPVTATEYFTAVYLEKNQPITNIGCYIGSTAAGTPTSSWLGLWTHPNFPTIKLTTANNTDWVYSVTRNGTTTLTKVTGTWPMSLTGRLITGTGITGGTWVVSQTTTTLVLSAAASGSGTMDATVGLFAGDKYNLGFTTNGSTGAIAANAAYTRPLTVGPYIVPAAGLYMLSFCFAATTMPTVTSMNANAGVSLTFHNDAPAWSQTHVNGTTNNTAPGTNPVTGGTLLNSRNIIYLFAT